MRPRKMKKSSRDSLVGVDRLGVWIANDPVGPTGQDLLVDAWHIARDEAVGAYDAWRRSSGDDYAVYVAAEERADAAWHAIELQHVRPRPLPPERYRD
jgi:hypothetical protein